MGITKKKKSAQDIPMRSERTVQSRKRKKKKNRHTFGKILAIIQIVLSVVFFAVLLMLNVLPMKYLVLVFGLFVFLGAFALGSQYTRSAHMIGKIDCVFMIILLLVANIYLIRANSTLLSITDNEYKIDRIEIVVLKDDAAQTLKDAADYAFGAQYISGSDKVEQAIAEASKEVGQDLQYTTYDDVLVMAQALYNGEVDALIYNAAYNDSIVEHYPTFEQDVRALDHIEIKTKLESSGNKKNVAKESFTVYISGIDTEGSIATTSRSDVNMLVTINPQTKQILMTSIPRDYYVELPGVSGGSRDKLTHAGLYGPECSMNTLAQLFGIDIDYYARVNFTTLRDMVNALGGVDLDGRRIIKNNDGTHYFVQGMNYDVDGDGALSFARERYNLPNGDNDRVLNQQIVLKAIINKCVSPAILTGYMGIMESLSDSFETSLSQKQISSLVRMQLGDGASWDIMSSSVNGTGDENYCYSSGDALLYVMEPNYDSVNTVADFIERIKDDEVISQDEINAAMSN